MAHVVPNGVSGAGRGMTHRYLSVIKNPGDYRAMCVKCHHTFDSLPWRSAFEQPIPF